MAPLMYKEMFKLAVVSKSKSDTGQSEVVLNLYG